MGFASAGAADEDCVALGVEEAAGGENVSQQCLWSLPSRHAKVRGFPSGVREADLTKAPPPFGTGAMSNRKWKAAPRDCPHCVANQPDCCCAAVPATLTLQLDPSLGPVTNHAPSRHDPC